MVIDTSAILAILLDEQKAPSLARAVVEDKNRLIGVFNVLEAETIIDAKKGAAGRKLLESLLRRIHAQILPLNHSQRNLAREAMRLYGNKQTGPGLDIGQCCAYALSKFTDEPLLFTSDAFLRTDVRAALPE